MASTQHSTRRRLGTCVAIALATCGLLAAAQPADASGGGWHHHPGRGHARPVTPGSHYLALGDSVTFGYREPANLPTPNYTDPTTFVGYPEDVAAELGVKTVNPSCPGETSSSLIDNTAPSYACETPTGYRTNFPLHVNYKNSQLQFAVQFLKHHRDTSLVSLMIGANDAFLCEATTKDTCASELPAVLAKIKANVATILGAIRKTGYRNQIVIVNYYSTDYTDPTANAGSLALNDAMDTAAKPFHVAIADGYGTFQRAAAQAGGDTCKAGLLTTLTTGGCGVHPSVAGQELLAGAVERVVHQR